MRWHSERVWRQDRTEKWERQQGRLWEGEGGKAATEMAINEMRWPSVSVTRLSSGIFYVLMKRERKKKRIWCLSRAKTTRMRWTRWTNIEQALITFTLRRLSSQINLNTLHQWTVAALRPSPSVILPRGLEHKPVDFSLARPQPWYDQWKWAGWKWEGEIDFPFPR